MNTHFYKKSGIAIMNIARDFFGMQIGEKIPTILENTEKFNLSRGIVQSAIAELEESKAVSIEKRGAKGTYLMDVNYEKLYPYTNWGSLTGTMPIPLNPYLSSLATAISEEMEQAPFTFSIAYVTGSEKRLEKLREMVFDFLVVSESTAKHYLQEYDFLEVCASLEDCVYSSEYVIYFLDEEKDRIEEGMKVGIDPRCLDQSAITKQLCEGKNVTYVEFPYIAIEDLLLKRNVDCVVYRNLDWSGLIDIVPSARKITGIHGFSEKETKTPVILSHKDNYGINKLIRRYVSQENTKRVQEEVLNGKKSMKFY